MNVTFVTRFTAAFRLAATVVAPVMLGSVPYAATKLTSDSKCLKAFPNSAQFA